MADEPTQPENPSEPEQQPQEPETDWKAEARKWEQRAKENKTAADRLAEIEEANKTEEQKRADRERALQEQINSHASENARLKAAIKFKLDEADLTALEGVPADKVEAIAERLASRSTPKPPALPGGLKSGTGAGLDQLTGKEKAAAALRALRADR
jgi:hypothetical protein